MNNRYKDLKCAGTRFTDGVSCGDKVWHDIDYRDGVWVVACCNCGAVNVRATANYRRRMAKLAAEYGG